MENHVFAAVLLAAFLHAGWNSLVKVGLDRATTMLLLTVGQAAIALPLLPFVDQPDLAAWPWIVASAVLHVGYKLFLVRAYTHADLSQAYPMARGTAPLIVTVVSALFLGARFDALALAAVLAISAGILTLALNRSGLGRMQGRALAYALGTACFTAAYTLVDGVGARVAETASGYILWMFVGDAALMVLYALVTRGDAAFSGLRASWKPGLGAGAMSVASYWIIVWAFTQVPIALVAGLRESSILFATLIAAFVLREPVSRSRWASVGLIAAGVVLMKL
ncbi:DMT family transporter [Amorphus orientalis]|uniref:Drug/metabolite transporter (DMT)-like permease n=1 Tax=Amorphus orientalis TaxID=649198 RepID=A0AAE4AU31_9HYPH|nr:DMT family transporter [Amorphus orientalis]MDQ0316933.1 drug/metabolite transporter (DMT)-like permease [Amorphus orientalis]